MRSSDRGASAAVEASGLNKVFEQVHAVRDLDLTVPFGSCFGIVGPNGAGKTTLLRMVTCVTRPSSGSLRVLGHDVTTQRRNLKSRIGVVPQGNTLDEELDVRGNLVTFARYFGLSRQDAARRADELLAFSELEDRAGHPVNILSGGLQRRLLVARALLNDPTLVVLDEPTTGLDLRARNVVWDRIRQLRRTGKTILVTTHYLEEASRLCDYVAIVDRGRVIAAGTPLELVRRYVPSRVVEVSGLELSHGRLRELIGDTTVQILDSGQRRFLYGRDGAGIATRIQTAELAYEAVLLREPSLEDVFLMLTGAELAEQ